MLILLDNARHPDQVRPLLPSTASCLVLITSRDQMSGLVARDGAIRLELDVLPPDEAQTLLRRLSAGPGRGRTGGGERAGPAVRVPAARGTDRRGEPPRPSGRMIAAHGPSSAPGTG